MIKQALSYSFPEAAEFLLGIHKLNILIGKIMENERKAVWLQETRRIGGSLDMVSCAFMYQCGIKM